MLTQEGTLTLRRTVRANPTEVFRAFTNQAALRHWLCNAAQVEARKGGRIYLWWSDGYYVNGVYTGLAKGESVAFTWQGPGEAASEVRISFAPQGEGTDVTVTHDGICSSEAAERISKLWEDGLENLQSVVETGNDLRFTRRPMFGLSDAEEMNTEIAAKIGAPVSEGLKLNGLVPGMGAEAAGLQKGDIIVGIGGRPVENFAMFVTAIEPHRAGDRVPVTFYRGAEEQTVTMELSARPTPEVPATAAALAERARQAHAELNKELDELFAGVSDEAAERRPAPDEWNAKEMLAHLIASEEDTQVWVAAMTEDADLEQRFHSNGKERVQAIVSVYSPLSVLIEELKRSQAVTAAITEAMSEETAGHKHLFNQLAQWLTDFDNHHREHFEEIKRLIA